MSPAVAQVGAGSAAKDVKKESGTARLLGSGRATQDILSIDRRLMKSIRFCRYCRATRFPPGMIHDSLQSAL